jgi:hypothetical protein
MKWCQTPALRQPRVLYTAADVTLGSRDSMIALLEVPYVLSLPIDSARLVVVGRGFTRVSIRSERDSVTSASVVVAQDPPGGRFVNPDFLVSIVVAIPALPVPDVRGLHPDDAEAAVTVRGLRLVIVDRVKALRFSPAVIVQSPAPPSPAQTDAVSVVVAIPLVPPGPAAAVFGVAVVGAAGYTIRRKRLLEEEKERKKRKEPPADPIRLDPSVSSRLGPDSVAPDSLIKGSLMLRVEVKEQPPDGRTPDGSLIKTWRPRDG